MTIAEQLLAQIAKHERELSPYRPGLPSIEDIQAHEARGGWWMVRSEVHLDMLRLVVEDGVVMENVPGGVYRAAGADLAAMRFRPCTTLGTPCPWPREEAQVAAQPCPACGQLSAIAFAVRLSHQRISAKAILDAAASRAAQAGQRSQAEVQHTLAIRVTEAQQEGQPSPYTGEGVRS